MKTTITILIAILLLAGGYYFFSPRNAEEQQSATIDTASNRAKQVALAQLQADLKDTEPHFIEINKNDRQALNTEEQKIKDSVVALFLAANPGNDKDYYSNLWLNAVGKRYVLAAQPSGGSVINKVIDSQTGEVSIIPGEASYSLASEGRNAALYIDTQAIYIYTLDQADAILVSGSQLSGNETYHSGTSDFRIAPEQTHTKNSITISIFDSSRIVRNPNAQPNAIQTMNKKLRSTTFSF